MSKELEDTLDAMVNTIEGISKAIAEMAEYTKSLETRISALEPTYVRANVQDTQPGDVQSGSRGGRL